MKSRCTDAMSVLEITATIAIIFVLAMAILPSIRQVTERSKAVTCTSNLRNIGAILLDYARERGSDFEVWERGSAGTMWNTRLIVDGYVTHASLKDLSCPNIEYASPSGSISGRHYGVYTDGKEGRVESFTDANGNTGLVYRLNVRTHPTPSKCIFLADSVTSVGTPSIRIMRGTSIAAGGIHTRHAGRANLFFLDGHVEAADPQALQRLGVEAFYTEKLQPVVVSP